MAEKWDVPSTGMINADRLAPDKECRLRDPVDGRGFGSAIHEDFYSVGAVENTRAYF